MQRKGGARHCCWGTCKSDSRFRDKIPDGVLFIPFPKPGKIRDGMTVLEKNSARMRTEKKQAVDVSVWQERF